MTRLHRAIAVAIALCIPSISAAQDLRLAVPDDMITSGFTKHLLPRFGFKTRIKIAPVAQGETADIAFVENSDDGTVVFRSTGGATISLRVDPSNSSPEKSDKFLDWLKSDPGKAAVEGFPSGGPSVYVTSFATEVKEVVVELDGDVAMGSKLALFHCGRCHVVDERNPFGGIGSTPSFPALRGRTGWSDLFLAFWTENPHPSFTQVTDVTEPFDDMRPSHIAPVVVTLEEIDAITAYVGTLEPKNLGAGVAAR